MQISEVESWKNGEKSEGKTRILIAEKNSLT